MVIVSVLHGSAPTSLIARNSIFATTLKHYNLKEHYHLCLLPYFPIVSWYHCTCSCIILIDHRLGHSIKHFHIFSRAKSITSIKNNLCFWIPISCQQMYMYNVQIKTVLSCCFFWYFHLVIELQHLI